MHNLKEQLIQFEQEVADRFESGEIKGPIHLSGGNEDQLIEIFKDIKPTDWVFSTWRSHYHALLHGIPPDKVMDQIMQGRSMNMMFPEHNFFTSAIVGGILPIAVGVAYAIHHHIPNVFSNHLDDDYYKKVWCFVGDMTSTTGIFHESRRFAEKHALPIRFVIEDNGLSCNSPTKDCWGKDYLIDRNGTEIHGYMYKRQWPHTGCGKWVNF